MLSFFFNLIYVFIYVFILGCVGAFSSRGERGPLPVPVRGPLTAGASPAAGHGLQARRPQQPWLAGSRAQAQARAGAAHGIFPDQGPNPCPLHWQADSQPLRHQGSSPTLMLSDFEYTLKRKETSFFWEWKAEVPFMELKFFQIFLLLFNLTFFLLLQNTRSPPVNPKL